MIRNRLTLFVLLTAAFLLLTAYRPFAAVQTVCPNCVEKGDKLTMPDGKTQMGDVIAKNQDGYIVSRFGELRFIQFPEIAKVTWAAGKEPVGLENDDQILLKNKEQTVLNGTLFENEPGKRMSLRSRKGMVYVVMPKEVLVYYQRGVRKAPVLTVPQ
jgi:hypothetical protein